MKECNENASGLNLVQSVVERWLFPDREDVGEQPRCDRPAGGRLYHLLQLTGFRKVLSVLEPHLTSENKIVKKRNRIQIHLFFIKSLENFRTFYSICETLENDVFPWNFDSRSPIPLFSKITWYFKLNTKNPLWIWDFVIKYQVIFENRGMGVT